MIGLGAHGWAQRSTWVRAISRDGTEEIAYCMTCHGDRRLRLWAWLCAGSLSLPALGSGSKVCCAGCLLNHIHHVRVPSAWLSMGQSVRRSFQHSDEFVKLA